MTDRDKLRGAFTAITLAITDVFFDDNKLAENETFFDRCMSFGKYITDEEHVHAIAVSWFHWTNILKENGIDRLESIQQAR